MNILVRLPTKLGDTIMAMPFLKALERECPEARIDVIVQAGIEELVTLMPMVNAHYTFNKGGFPGLRGKMKFGRMIKRQARYDLFFCLPYSFSSALIGFFTDARKRVGWDTEHRKWLLTQAYRRPIADDHVGREFIYLLGGFLGRKLEAPPVVWNRPLDLPPGFPSGKYVVLNVNSGDQSRIVPKDKAVSLLRDALGRFEAVVMVGSPKEREYADEIVRGVKGNKRVWNMAGKTGLLQLAAVLQHAQGVVSTDSGIAHLANFLGMPLVLLFGATRISRCHPMNPGKMIILQDDSLDCIPCMQPVCALYGEPLCLKNLDNNRILQALEKLMD